MKPDLGPSTAVGPELQDEGQLSRANAQLLPRFSNLAARCSILCKGSVCSGTFLQALQNQHSIVRKAKQTMQPKCLSFVI